MTSICRQTANAQDYFADGMLHRFEEAGELVVSVWPEPRARLKLAGGRWQETGQQVHSVLAELLEAGRERPPDAPPVPEELPPLPESPEISQVLAMFGGQVVDERVEAIAERNRDAFAAWQRQHALFSLAQTIPEPVRRILYTFSHGQWNILNLLAHCPGADELYASNPTLFFMLAHIKDTREPALRHPMQTARRLLRRPQRQVLEWFGFPPLETVRRSLSRITPAAVGLYEIERLRELIQDAKVRKMLSHLPVINAGVLGLISMFYLHPYLTPCLLAEVAADRTHDRETNLDAILNDSISMSRNTDAVRMPSSFTSMERLYHIHDELMRRCVLSNEKIAEQMYSGTRPDQLPEPPFPGNEVVIPIRTVRDLWREGSEQDHCVGCFASRVLDGDAYIYKVLQPVRATAEIVLHHKTWSLGQIYGARNKPVSPPVVQAVGNAILGPKQHHAQTDLQF